MNAYKAYCLYNSREMNQMIWKERVALLSQIQESAFLKAVAFLYTYENKCNLLTFQSSVYAA